MGSMQNIITGEVRSGTPSQAQGDQGWAPVSSSPSGQRSDAWSASTPQREPERPALTLDRARAKADRAFSGMQSPMTIDEIRRREQEAQEMARRTAGSIYAPRITQSERLGRGEVSTVEGVVGQSQGFNISTAESAYLANTQREVQGRTQEIVNQKAQFIAEGDFNAANRADEQLSQLREYENQLMMAKANYALQLMQGDRDAARLTLEQQRASLQERQFEFEKEVTTKQLGFAESQLTGTMPDGTPTLDAVKFEVNKAFQEASLTGFYQGEETIQRVETMATLALRERGVNVQEGQLALSIRAQAHKESMDRAAASRASSAGIFTQEQMLRLTQAGLNSADPMTQLDFLYGDLEGAMKSHNIRQVVDNSDYSTSDAEIEAFLKTTYNMSAHEAKSYVDSRKFHQLSNSSLQALAFENIKLFENKATYKTDGGGEERFYKSLDDIQADVSFGRIYDPIRNDFIDISGNSNAQRTLNAIIEEAKPIKSGNIIDRFWDMFVK